MRNPQGYPPLRTTSIRTIPGVASGAWSGGVRASRGGHTHTRRHRTLAFLTSRVSCGSLSYIFPGWEGGSGVSSQPTQRPSNGAHYIMRNMAVTERTVTRARQIHANYLRGCTQNEHFDDIMNEHVKLNSSGSGGKVVPSGNLVSNKCHTLFFFPRTLKAGRKTVHNTSLH